MVSEIKADWLVELAPHCERGLVGLGGWGDKGGETGSFRRQRAPLKASTGVRARALASAQQHCWRGPRPDCLPFSVILPLPRPRLASPSPRLLPQGHPGRREEAAQGEGQSRRGLRRGWRPAAAVFSALGLEPRRSCRRVWLLAWLLRPRGATPRGPPLVTPLSFDPRFHRRLQSLVPLLPVSVWRSRPSRLARLGAAATYSSSCQAQFSLQRAESPARCKDRDCDDGKGAQGPIDGRAGAK